MKDTLEKRLLAGFGVVLIIQIIALAVAVRNTHQSIASSDWVNHTHAVILEVDAIRSSLHAAEAALRSFLITGSPRDQADYREAFSELAEHLQVAKSLTADDPRQQQRLRALDPLITSRVELAREIVRANDTGGFTAVRQKLSERALDDALREIGRVVGKLKQEENQLLQQRDWQSHANARLTRAIVFAGAGLNLALLAFIFWLIRDDLNMRRRAAEVLQQANTMLEAKVRERTADLSLANQSLELEIIERRWAHIALGRQHRHNELIINSIGEGIFVVSRSGNIIRLNPAATRLGGWEAAELAGRPLGKVLRHLPAGALAPQTGANPVSQAIREEHELHGQQGILWRKDGAITPVRFSCFPVRDDDRVVGAVVICASTSPAAK